jgi:hypothetical protein
LLGIAIDYYMVTARRPFLLMGIAAAAAVAVGLVVLLSAQSMIGLLLICIGALGALMALIGEYAQRIYHLEQGIPFYELRKVDEGGGGSIAQAER